MGTAWVDFQQFAYNWSPMIAHCDLLTNQRRETYEAADQPDQEDQAVHSALRPLGGVVDGVMNGPVPE